MSSQGKLFEPMLIGDTAIQHRIVLPPLTRRRATDDHVPTDIMVDYYDQRSRMPGTLLITEATFIDPIAGGMENVPGIWNDEQIDGWKKIVDKVHANGSKIYMQLWALGRSASEKVLKKELGPDAKVVSSSNVPQQDGDVPTPLTVSEIKEYVQLYVRAAKNFIEKAGGDGVEIHGANGYLIDQFLQVVANKRDDEYNGSTVEGRTKFALEVLEAVAKAVGQKKTAIRMNPLFFYKDLKEELNEGELKEQVDVIKKTFVYYTKQIKQRLPNLAYLHAVMPRTSGNAVNGVYDQMEVIDFIYEVWKPYTFIIAGGLNADTAKEAVEKYENTAVGIGRFFISNPDLPQRIKAKVDFTPYNRSTFYVKGPTGYTDYPFHKTLAKA